MTQERAERADVAAIEDYNRRLAAATSNGDLTALEQLIAVDHVTLPPDQAPVVGRDASIAIMRDALERFRVTEIHRATKTEVASTLAYQWGEFSVSLVAKSGGQTISRSGKYLRVYRRCADRSWIMIVDSFSANHPDGGWDEIVSVK